MINPPETPAEERKRLLQEQEGRNIQHYMVLATSWVNTLMEHDKSIITLSSAAIGLLITILTTKGVDSGWLIPLYFCSFVAYLMAIIVTKRILKDNAIAVENEIRQALGQAPIGVPNLKKFDKLADYSFNTGTIIFVLIGLLTAAIKLCEPSPKSNTPPPPQAEVAPPKPLAPPQPKAEPGHRRKHIKTTKQEYRVICLNCVQTNTSSCKNCREARQVAYQYERQPMRCEEESLGKIRAIRPGQKPPRANQEQPPTKTVPVKAPAPTK